MSLQPARRRILVVEDDPWIRALLERLLGDPFQVEVAPGGTQGVERCRTTAFDAVVTDVRMPDLDGVSMVQALRGKGLEMPVVFLTGSPEDVSPARLAALQPAQLLAKPYGIERLRAALAQMGL
jgi:CheY-like chemotaxis protein